jgi:hypothetical protein
VISLHIAFSTIQLIGIFMVYVHTVAQGASHSCLISFSKLTSIRSWEHSHRWSEQILIHREKMRAKIRLHWTFSGSSLQLRDYAIVNRIPVNIKHKPLMAHPLHLLCRFIPKHPGFYNHLSFPEIGDKQNHLFLLGPELNSKERNPQHES